MEDKIFIHGYYGFGDNIWQFPFIKEACRKYKTVYLETYYPFLFDSIPNIKFVKPRRGKLQTCNDCLDMYEHINWVEKPVKIKQLQFPYYLSEMRNGLTLVECFNKGITISDEIIDYNLPINPDWIKEAKKVTKQFNTKKKICLVKPPSNRKDWSCSARVPKAEYFQYLIDKNKKDYFFVTIGNKEIDVYESDLSGIGARFDNGELPLTTILGLIAISDMVMTYNNFFFPAGVALKTNTLVIGGGYTHPALYVDLKRMDLRHVAIVTPEEPCICFNLNHDCNKNIKKQNLTKAFNLLKKNKSEIIMKNNLKVASNHVTVPKENLLCARIRAYRCAEIANNKWIKDKFNIYIVDHTGLEPYKQFGNLFKGSWQFPSCGDICRPTPTESDIKKIYEFCKKILVENNITKVINAQPLHPYNTVMGRVCKELGIDCLNYETFCDDKMILDRVGCQYTCPNEIYKYVDKVKFRRPDILELPKKTRQPQPENLTAQEFFKKYQLDPKGQYIVLLGQLLWDMSVIRTVNPEIKNYIDYVHLVISKNPRTHFIIKPHPIYLARNHRDMRIFKNYKNVTIVNESLDTLFNAFSNFTSFSSTAILEGIIRQKKFATIGFHFCNNDKLAIQLRVNERAEELYSKLNRFKIHNPIREQYLNFICNYYTVAMNSKKLYYRLTMTSDEYFKLNF